MIYKFIALTIIVILIILITLNNLFACGHQDCTINPPENLVAVYFDAHKEHPEGLTECELIAQDLHESNFDPSARSPAGALGIAQFEPGTAAEYGFNPLDPVASIHAQAAYMARLMHVWHRHEERRERVALALASYNWGIGNMLKSQTRHGWNTWENASQFLPSETRNYVQRIMRDGK